MEALTQKAPVLTCGGFFIGDKNCHIYPRKKTLKKVGTSLDMWEQIIILIGMNDATNNNANGEKMTFKKIHTGFYACQKSINGVTHYYELENCPYLGTWVYRYNSSDGDNSGEICHTKWLGKQFAENHIKSII